MSGAGLARAALPPFLRPLAVPVPAPADALGGEAGGRAGPVSRILAVKMIGQQADNWCWSAVTQTVIGFITNRAPPGQDQIATAHIPWDSAIVCQSLDEDRMNGGSCGKDGDCRGHCNDAHIARIVLAENGRLRETIAHDAPPGFDQIQAEINTGRPVVCRVGWTVGGGHFILVTGWTLDANGRQRVHILDPKKAEGGVEIPQVVLPYEDFAERYVLGASVGSINFAYGVK